MEHNNCGEGLDQCQFTDTITYEIKDKDGNVVDRTTYERLVPITYYHAMALKYLRIERNVTGGAQTFLDILSAGDPITALGKQSQ